MYEPDQGDILIDGQAIRDVSLRSLRTCIGLVSQDVYLFEGTVRENLVYGNPDASDSDIIEAAKTAEAWSFIEVLPQGLETLVGERGARLSGGQRQRLSLARALLKNPPILVLDEATSAVDNETEAAIQRSLKRIGHNRTVIMIAHRLSTIVDADSILVIGDGQVIEQGNHQTLLEGRRIRLSMASTDGRRVSINQNLVGLSWRDLYCQRLKEDGLDPELILTQALCRRDSQGNPQEHPQDSLSSLFSLAQCLKNPDLLIQQVRNDYSAAATAQLQRAYLSVIHQDLALSVIAPLTLQLFRMAKSGSPAPTRSFWRRLSAKARRPHAGSR